MTDEYLKELEKSCHPVLAEMEAEAKEKDFPIIGPQCGRRLMILAMAIGATRVFEMGSGYGYSTVWFCHAVGADGEVVHTDGDSQNTARAKEYLSKAGFESRTRFLTGDAIGLLEAEEGPFDVVLIDIDKQDYPKALAVAVPKLRVGGLILTHNTKWFGKAADPSVTDEATLGIRQYNVDSFAHPELATYIDPADDGLGVSLKVGPARAGLPI